MLPGTSVEDRNHARHGQSNEKTCSHNAVFWCTESLPLGEDHREESKDGEARNVAELGLRHAVEVVVDPGDEAA